MPGPEIRPEQIPGAARLMELTSELYRHYADPDPEETPVFTWQTVPSTVVTADLLREEDLDTLQVLTPSGRRIGEKPSLAFGLGSFEGDHEAFAAWLRDQA